jgi:lipoate-protein ligase A
METKGVASHPSPVTTLNTQLPQAGAIDHDAFVKAVCMEFADVYAKSGEEMVIHHVQEEQIKEEKIWKGVEELKTWEWTFGQTPEFGNTIEGELSIGKIVGH